jgi:hypothetical protein
MAPSNEGQLVFVWKFCPRDEEDEVSHLRLRAVGPLLLATRPPLSRSV